MTSRETYEQEAKKNTEEEAGTSLNDMEQVNSNNCVELHLSK